MVYEVTACSEIGQHMSKAYYTEIVLSKSRKEHESYVLVPHHLHTRRQDRGQSICQAMGGSQVRHAEVVIQLLLGNITAEKDSILYRKVTALGLVLVG